MTDFETIVVGAGVVGLAVACALARSGRAVTVVERHGLIGSETSSRNSEVIHAGIYYPPGSLKARLCVAGKHALYAYCRAHGVGHARIGKLIVATAPEQIATLAALRETAARNGVDDLDLVGGAQARALEPELCCVAALRSPSTGIVDSHGLMLALEGELDTYGGQVVLRSPVTSLAPRRGGGFDLVLGGGEAVSARAVVLACGLHTSRLMAGLGHASYAAPPTRFAKGSYYGLAGRAPFSRLVYPVPEPGGLGVHLTLDLAGRARFGPDVEWLEGNDPDALDYDVDPRRADAFYAAIRRYWPGLPDGALTPDYAGVRPKLSAPGAPAADFAIHGPEAHDRDGLVALYGIESPGLTAALAIGAEVAARLGVAPVNPA